MYEDRISRFLGASREAAEPVFEKPLNLSLTSYLDDPKDCFFFSRDCDLEDMETEDDERYVFTNCDYTVTAKFSRFETRAVFLKLNPNFNQEKIDLILKTAWNYKKIIVNQKTTEFLPFNDQADKLPPMPPSGGPPRRIIYTD